MPTSLAQLAWIAAFGALMVIWGRKSRIGRTVEASVPRGELIGAALLVAALALGGAWVWGAKIADDGLARVSAGLDEDAPARARLFLRHVQLFFQVIPPDSPGAKAPPLRATVGYSPTAALKLPRDYGLDEAGTSQDVLNIDDAGPTALALTPLPGGQATTTRVLIDVRPRGTRSGEIALARVARSLLGGKQRCPVNVPPAATPSSTEPLVYTVILCAGDEPRAALVLERDLGLREARPIDTPIRVSPYVWRGDGFHPHHVHVEAGTLIQIGAVSDALPGLTVWEIPAPTGRPGLLFPPKNVLAPCKTWLEGNSSAEGGFFYPSLGVVEAPQPDTSAADAFACVLPFTPPFALEVRRLLPDTAGAWTRSLWAATFVIAPVLVLLLFIFVQRATARTPALFARVLGVAAVSATLSAHMTWRLLWALRLDMMRDYESVGTRVIDNELLTVLVGAALAGVCASVWLRQRQKPTGALATTFVAAIAWAVVAAVGWVAIAPDVPLTVSPRLLAQAAMALALGTSPAWWSPIWTGFNDLAQRRPLLAKLGASPELLPPLLGLLGIAIVVAGAIRFAHDSVPVKLGAAWTFIPVAYMTLRALRASRWPAVLLAFAILGACLLLMVRLDTGVSVVISGTGLILGMLAVAHDTLYADDDAKFLDAFGRHYRPLLGIEGIGVLSASLAVCLWAGAGVWDAYGGGSADSLFPRTFTRAVLHVLVLLCALFAGTAFALARRARRLRGKEGARGLARRAAAWGVIAALFLGVWGARGPLVSELLSHHSEASHRVASILDPSYALLADEHSFAKGLTAWRETAIPAARGPSRGPVLDGGQGYFGAQVLDPGVLLSIENDYLPVLLLRETGAAGMFRMTLWFLVLCGGLWIFGGGRFPEGSAALRSRRALAGALGVLVVYQPISSLGALPFTGIAWPGCGIDSPSDLFALLAILLFIIVLGPETPAPVPSRANTELRASPAYRRSFRLIAVAAGALCVAGALIVYRVGTFAMGRREPVELTATHAGEPTVRLNPPFDGMAAVFDYVYRMQCALPSPKEELPAPLLGEPGGGPDSGISRFHKSYQKAWAVEQAEGRAELARWQAGKANACTGKKGHWSYERHGDGCQMTFKFGWPAYQLAYTKGTPAPACDVIVSEDILRSFRYPPRRPYANARVRLVSQAEGRSASDRGELVSGQVVVRLRPGAGPLDLADAKAGVFYADRVRLGEDVEVRIVDKNVEVRRPQAPAVKGAAPARVMIVGSGAPRVHSLESATRWDTRILDASGAPTPLDALSVIVTGGTSGRSVWLFRPTADPLLADDVTTILGGKKRSYVYGGLLPELGWVDAPVPDHSLGLDGWTTAAVGRWERAAFGTPGAAAEAPSGPSAQAKFRDQSCGNLLPPVPATAGDDADAAFAKVCTPSPMDHVLECRVALQPELEIRLRQVLELTSTLPERFTARKGFHPAIASSFALLRGDTGEILAQGNFVPGRESTAYAPATPSLEKYLIDARDNRDPKTGKKVPPGETGAEKADWVQPIAIGSTMKPLLARALERAAPDVTREMVLTATGKRTGCEPLLGHCPPTVTLWNHTETPAELSFYIAESLNWFQAAVGLLGTAFPDGEFGFGDDKTPQPIAFPIAAEARDEQHRLWTRYHGRDVILPNSTIDVAALRTTPMWKEFELILGRPLCEGSKEECTRAGERRDLCAVRALPIEAPSADLRHLVALGPSSFDFSSSGAPAKRQSIKEYFQFLRGSGKHPLASTLQLADAFNRLFFDPTATGAYQLAASWYPSPVVGVAPPVCGKSGTGDHTVRAGLCRALTEGTVGHLAPRLDDTDKIVFYGAKTGTIDSLGDIAEERAACEAFNLSHTLADSADQPYHLSCASPDRPSLNDSLLVVGFGVKPPGGGAVIPMTLVVRYQRAGSALPYGYAVEAIEPFLDVVMDYFGVAP